MKIKGFAIGEMQVNCYVLEDEETGEGAIVDPGRYAPEVEEEVKKLKKLKYILLTHGHFDHVWEVKFAKEKTGAEIVISKEDAGCLNDDPHNLCHHAGIEMNKCYADITVSDGDELFLGNEKIKVLHTPGHTQGSVCYLMENSRILISGDTLFCRTCGRTDFEGGSQADMLKSLKRLKELDGDYAVYPGHNRATTLSEERVKNRYMKRELDKWCW